jgi:hypothetical protein
MIPPYFTPELRMVLNGSKDQLADSYIMTERTSLSQFARELEKRINPMSHLLFKQQGNLRSGVVVHF